MKQQSENPFDFFKFFCEQNPEPYFPVENLSPTDRLSFELLDEQNYERVYDIFKEDPSPFVLSDYKDRDELAKYAKYMLQYNRYSPKHGACDWLVKLKATETHIGLLNVYELSRETFADNHKKCMIGFSTAAPFRRQYYTLEAVGHLIEYVHTVLGRNKIIANTQKDNEASKALLRKMNFQERTEHYYYKESYDYFELNIP